jgi:hypothetical protein
MKRALFLVVMSLCAFAAFCQDVIVMRNGDEIEAILQDIGISEVKYQRYSNPDGPAYTVLKSDIFMIKYANGEKETFSEAAASAPADGGFPTMQRVGTWVANSFIPGVGSFIIMKDYVGGGIQLVTAGLGIGLMIGGTVKLVRAPVSTYGGDPNTSGGGGTAAVVIGSLLWVGTEIFNIVRSVKYNPPATKVARGFDPAALQVAVIPGNHKIDKVSLSYTIRF